MALLGLSAIGQALAACVCQAAELINEEMRALFRPSVAASAVPEQAQLPELLSIPTELVSIILTQLDTLSLACLAATCRLLWCDEPIPLEQPALEFGLVETELRLRADARGLHIDSSLPDGAMSWVSYLLRRVLYETLRRKAPLAVGDGHSLFVDREGRLHLACRLEEIQVGQVGESLLGQDWGSDTGTSVSVSLGLVRSMQDTRIVSVASSNRHCLALSTEGEVFSWGDGADGALGHADRIARGGPSRIETLERVVSIAAGLITSAAVDDRGRLFTWGYARSHIFVNAPTGLGYELDPEMEFQLTPKRVDSLSEDHVVGVAVGYRFTLAVTDVGAVFSFGQSRDGALGHGSLEMESEVLPRRIEALAETGLRFVAVAAGTSHALALTEEGEVYGWGDGRANGRGQGRQSTPQLLAAFAGEPIKLVAAQSYCSCAVTESGALFTWGRGLNTSLNLGHGVGSPQLTPKRVEALGRAKVATAAICGTHTLVADADGVVWGFGWRAALGLGDTNAPPWDCVMQPNPIPTLRVRTLQ